MHDGEPATVSKTQVDRAGALLWQWWNDPQGALDEEPELLDAVVVLLSWRRRLDTLDLSAAIASRREGHRAKRGTAKAPDLLLGQYRGSLPRPALSVRADWRPLGELIDTAVPVWEASPRCSPSLLWARTDRPLLPRR